MQAKDNYAEFIRSSLTGAPTSWRICTWRKHLRALQTGDSVDATGWDVYDACLDSGAMVVVAHEHTIHLVRLLSGSEPISPPVNS